MTSHVVSVTPATRPGLEPHTPGAAYAASNLEDRLVSYDDTITEYLGGSFGVPNDLDASGTVTFRAVVKAATAAAAKFAGLRFQHAPRSSGDDIEGAPSYTAEDSGDIAMDATQGQVTIHEWTETVAALGWAAGDWVAWRLSRIAPAGADLVGDLDLIQLDIEIPTRPSGLNVVRKTASYTALVTDDVIEADCTAGDVTITLYPMGPNPGGNLHVRRIDGSANSVIIDPSGAETINGDATVTLSDQYDSAHIYVGATEWGIL